MKKGESQKKARRRISEVDTQGADLKVNTGNNILDSLFNEELVKLEKYDQNIVSMVRNHLGRSNLNAKAGTKLAEDLIKFAKSSLAEAPK